MLDAILTPDGPWRRLRWRVDFVLLAILLAIPWINVNGSPLLRLDIPARRFYVLGGVIFPNELLFLWFIIFALAIALFFFTALYGRIWCGLACPQTVISDLFAGIARFVEGARNGRRAKRVSPARLALIHGIWIAASAVLGLHFVGYFSAPGPLLAGEASTRAYAFVGGATAFAYLDFAWLRQTFCKYLCPYARFQGVLFDPDTLVVGYDQRRGEPRGKRGVAEGDCVDCGMCVQACPTLIDIRQGLQLECISCAQCIDACDSVMTKLDREPGLIAYSSLVELEGRRETRSIRPRTFAYGVLLAASCAAFATLALTRDTLGLVVERNRSQLYQTLPDGRVANAYQLHVQNRRLAAADVRISLDAPEGLELLAGVNPISVPGAGSAETTVFVVADENLRWAQTALPMDLGVTLSDDTTESTRRQTTFVLPHTGSHR